jgi:hypothetical protein
LVNDLTAAGKIEFNDPTKLDKTVSLARWIRVKRGPLNIKPGEKYELSLSVEVDMNARPGVYHAAVSFSQASNMPAAEAAAITNNLPTLLVNMTVEDGAIEKAQIGSFKSLKNIFFQLPVIFNLNVDNIGNQPISPQGTMIIYDRQGREVDALNINGDKKNIPPETTENFVFEWKPAPAKILGKYRAKINLVYGEKAVRDLSDSIYFWILPLRYLVIILVVALIIIILLTIIMFRLTYHRHQPARSKADGVINLKNQR